MGFGLGAVAFLGGDLRTGGRLVMGFGLSTGLSSGSAQSGLPGLALVLAVAFPRLCQSSRSQQAWRLSECSRHGDTEEPLSELSHVVPVSTWIPLLNQLVGVCRSQRAAIIAAG